ncbi:MAG: hypothetical protein JJ899_14760 [Alphaproteobacteria bacterium]|nr:hypothetical protein [Alphaproteobacteria bacterium]
MESIERIATSREPPAPPIRRAAERDRAEETERAPEAPEARALKLPEPEGNIFQARLSYDPDEADVFVEILDPTTGEVLRRLPAERAADDAGGARGAVLDRMA